MFQIASFKIICTDSTKILFSQILLKYFFFSKLGSAGLNYHLSKPSFFTDPYWAGVSNKHCLLTFFHSHTFSVLENIEKFLNFSHTCLYEPCYRYVTDCRSRGCDLFPALSHNFAEIDHEIFLRPFSYLPLIQQGLLSATRENMCTKYWFTT